MKFYFKYYTSILLLATLTLSVGCTDRNELQARKYLDFSLPYKALTPIEENEEWNDNPGGDGWEYVIFSFKPDDSSKITTECIKHNFKPLPIDESELPDNAIYQFTDTSTTSGYYKFEIDSVDKKSYSLVVLEFNRKNIIVYRSFY